VPVDEVASNQDLDDLHPLTIELVRTTKRESLKGFRRFLM
jgi:hypothetical protein